MAEDTPQRSLNNPESDPEYRGSLLKTDSGSQLLRTTSKQNIECREVKLVPVSYLQPYVLVSMALEGSLRLWKEKPGWQPSYKTLDLQSLLPTICAGEMVAQNLWDWLTKVWFNSWLTSWEGAQVLHCLDGQEL